MQLTEICQKTLIERNRMEALKNIIDELKEFPMIGEKSAFRMAIHLLSQSDDDTGRFVSAIQSLRKSVTICKTCFGFSGNGETCHICSSDKRKNIICVVEKPTDILSIEKSGQYNGTYHVLGGLLSPIDGITADKLNFAELKTRVAGNPPVEIIIGLSGGSDAEITGTYTQRLFSGTGIKISRFARGIPFGLELEYVDVLTMGVALDSRVDIKE